MRVFQIEAEICYWDATSQFPTVESTTGYFPPDILFVEAPDYVKEGWGYVDNEFIEPTPPEGYLYDRETGTFYPEDYDPEEYTVSGSPENNLSERLLNTLLDSIIA